MGLVNDVRRKVHSGLVFSRRVEKLTQALDALLPASASILDVGCGGGLISWNLQQLQPGRQFTGIDVVQRDKCMIPCQMYDGETLPFAPKSFDYVLFVDVLHHAHNEESLLAQSKRIARKSIVLKDHYSESALDFYTLAAMDWFGNAPYGIPLPNNFKSAAEWREIFKRLGLKESRIIKDIGLYPAPFSMVFGRGLHFVSTLEVT